MSAHDVCLCVLVTGLLIIKPPLKDFRAPDFHVCFYYSQLFWQKSEFAFIILKKFSPAAGSYYYIFLRRPNLGSPEVDFFYKIRVFALKYP